MADSPGPTAKSIWGRRSLFVGFCVAGLASVFGLLGLLTVAISKVRDGRGLETYRTLWLVEFSYVGVLVLFAALIVALFVAVALWWREERQWRDLERKYGARQPNA